MPGISYAGRRDRAERIQKLPAIVVDRMQADIVEKIRERTQHHVPVFDHVADAGGGAGIVLQHHEGAVLVAYDVGAADMDIGRVRQIDAAHDLSVIGVAQDQIGRQHAIPENHLIVVEIIQQMIKCRDALRNPVSIWRHSAAERTRGMTSNGKMRSIDAASE